MPESEYQTHTNSEPVRKCPYCDWTGKSRGLTFHVLNKNDEDHGKKHELPPDFNASEAEIVGYEDVSLKMPEHYNTSKRKRYVCDYCGKVCRGKGGLKVHLSHMEGDDVHPEGAADREADTFPSFVVDGDGNVVAEDEDALAIATGGAVSPEGSSEQYQGMIPIQELQNLRDEFMRLEQEGESFIAPMEAAEMVEDVLERYQHTDPDSP